MHIEQIGINFIKIVWHKFKKKNKIKSAWKLKNGIKLTKKFKKWHKFYKQIK